MENKTHRIPFTAVRIGASFIFNGTHWYKKSQRTACVYGKPDRWFYFSHKDIVTYNQPY